MAGPSAAAAGNGAWTYFTSRFQAACRLCACTWISQKLGAQGRRIRILIDESNLKTHGQEWEAICAETGYHGLVSCLGPPPPSQWWVEVSPPIFYSCFYFFRSENPRTRMGSNLRRNRIPWIGILLGTTAAIAMVGGSFAAYFLFLFLFFPI